MYKFFSIIPARIGSKGIHKKNLSPLYGKPLIQWTLESSIKSAYISETIISSDSDEVLYFCSNNNSYIKHKRPERYANDSARSEDVIFNILEDMEYLVEAYDYLVLLQPTSPLRTFEHIDEACKKIIESKSSSLLSVKEINNSVLKTLIEDPIGQLKSGFNRDYPFMPRQELPKAYIPNGAIYITKISSFQENKRLLTKNNSFFLMNETSSIDIDSNEDLNKAELIIKTNELKKN